MPLVQPCGWADEAGKYRNRFSGFWKVFETILLSVMDRVKSRKVTAVVVLDIDENLLSGYFSLTVKLMHK